MTASAARAIPRHSLFFSRPKRATATAFESAHLHGKALEQLHEEIGFHDPAEERYHDKFKTVLGMTSYGHRLLFLKELQELLGPIKWRR